MRTIMITGRTGSGKSKLIERLSKRLQLKVIDPLGASNIDWQLPETGDGLDAVVFDHTRTLRDSRDQVVEVIQWCRLYKVNVVFVVQFPDDYIAMKLEKVASVDFRLHVSRDYEKQGASKVSVASPWQALEEGDFDDQKACRSPARLLRKTA